MATHAWDEGRWTNPPAAVHQDGADLIVTAVAGSDAWRITSYGFTHDTEHALLVPFAAPGAMEVTFVAALPELYDQAGIFIRASDTLWIKAGVERADGLPQVGAVVTNQRSDWSLAPVPDWDGRLVTIRASRAGDAITLRARVDDEPFRLIRVVPLDPALALEAGPFTCAPTRAGLAVRFTSWATGDADAALHGDSDLEV